MYRLLLLDDEEIVTRGIQKVFDLEKSGFQVVGVFQNPQKALESLPGLQPDLMITDIKMPQMSGLDFAAEAKQLLPESEIVILSGYGDFGFAQSAVKIGVSDYLLKPIKKMIFSRCWIQCMQNWRKRKHRNSRQIIWHCFCKIAIQN